MKIKINFSSRIWILGLALSIQGYNAAAQAEPSILPDCDGVYGFGIVGYSKIDGPNVATTNELSEICWNDQTATFRTAHESSRDLELTAQQGGTAKYQRLNGGTVSPENEQLQVGTWESRPDGSLPYVRWTTENSRSREELKGNDYVTAEGFLVGTASFTPKPQSAIYDVEMQITGVGGSIMSMVFNMFLPMQGEVAITGDALSVSLVSFMPNMGPGDVKLNMDLTETDVGFDGDAHLTMKNELLAGAPPMMWKKIDLRLEELATFYSGDEMAFVGSFTGEMQSFAGESSRITYSLIGSGKQR